MKLTDRKREFNPPVSVLAGYAGGHEVVFTEVTEALKEGGTVYLKKSNDNIVEITRYIYLEIGKELDDG
jgi:hypothetical protein